MTPRSKPSRANSRWAVVRMVLGGFERVLSKSKPDI